MREAPDSDFKVVEDPVRRFTAFGNRGDHQIGTANDIATGEDFRVAGLEGVSLPSGAIIRPWESSSTLCFASHSMLCGRKPNAMTTASAGTTCSEPGTISARRRPFASGWPISVRAIFTPQTLPLAFTCPPSGWTLNWNSTPSSRAFFAF